MDSPPAIVVSVLTAWALLYLPGQALLRAGSSSLPLTFARVVVSVILTTLVGTGLTAAEVFSLGGLLAGNAAASALLLALRNTLAPATEASRPGRDLVGPAIVVAALAVYWPAYPVFLGGSDATAYLGTGVSLARHGTLAREDRLGPAIPMAIRTDLFDSMSQVLFNPGPPYRRVPGAMLVQTLEDTQAWPCFFPVPSVWAAISSLRGGVLDEQRAPDFGPLFGALALWAFWQLGRQWLGGPWALLATVLLGATGTWYRTAHMPMSEMIAAFFVLAGLAFTAAAAGSHRRADALIAGAAFGAAVFTRVEVAILLMLALALLPSVARRDADSRPPLPGVFFAALVVVASLTIVQAIMLPGTYLQPLTDHVGNIRQTIHLRFGPPSWWVIAATSAVLLAVFALVARILGFSRTVRWGIVLGAVAGHAAASRFLFERTPMWLSFDVGWSGLALFVTGAALAWRARASLPAGSFVLALAAAVSLILFYNPHVYPALPWGSRRFVPMLLPLVVLLACHAGNTAGARSRVLAVVVAALLAWPVYSGTKGSWGEDVLPDAWEQLEGISKEIPEHGVILVDRELSRLMLAPSLWLVRDRNNVTVPPIDSPIGAEIMQKLALHFHAKWPLYYVTRGTGGIRQPPYTTLQRAGTTALRLRVLESTYRRPPEHILSEVLPIHVYRVTASFDPKPRIVQ